jgi:hypothetical protein
VNRTKVIYANLNSRQQESFNYAKLAAALADYGYTCVRMHDDYLSGDLLALRDGETLNVQLKSRLTIDQKYECRDLWLAFPDQGTWYMIEHDELVDIMAKHTTALDSASWQEHGHYNRAPLSKQLKELLGDYAL